MGNTPTQEPVSNGSSTAGDAAASRSLLGSLRGAVGSVVGGVRARLSVFSTLEFGPAFRLDGEDGQRPSAPRRGRRGGTTGSAGALPPRERPFSHPARDGANQPDLRATEERGQLSIYYPDREDATITSDTWQRVER
ncbi:MAG: hypothetical protein ABEJ31_06650 [Haloarculaceae archaeon]